jgi:hypothetical protein
MSVWTGAENIRSSETAVCSNSPYRLSYAGTLKVRDIKMYKKCTVNLTWSWVCATNVVVEKQELVLTLRALLLWLGCNRQEGLKESVSLFVKLSQ